MESWSLDFQGTGSAPSLTLNSIPVVRQPIQQSWYHHPCWSLSIVAGLGQVHRPCGPCSRPRVDVNQKQSMAPYTTIACPHSKKKKQLITFLLASLFFSPRNRSLPAKHWDTTAEKSQHLLSISWQLPGPLWIPMWFGKGKEVWRYFPKPLRNAWSFWEVSVFPYQSAVFRLVSHNDLKTNIGPWKMMFRRLNCFLKRSLCWKPWLILQGDGREETGLWKTWTWKTMTSYCSWKDRYESYIS